MSTSGVPQDVESVQGAPRKDRTTQFENPYMVGIEMSVSILSHWNPIAQLQPGDFQGSSHQGPQCWSSFHILCGAHLSDGEPLTPVIFSLVSGDRSWQSVKEGLESLYINGALVPHKV